MIEIIVVSWWHLTKIIINYSWLLKNRHIAINITLIMIMVIIIIIIVIIFITIVIFLLLLLLWCSKIIKLNETYL